MTSSPRRAAALPLLLILLTALAAAADFAPEDQPLAVGRAASAADVLALLDTRQARALGLEQRDVAGELRGTGVATPSLRALLAALADADAADLWYGLMQRGASAAQQTGIIGFTLPPGSGADAQSILDDAAPDSTAKLREDDGAAGRRVVLFPDIATLTEARAGAARTRTSGWRGSLASFLRDTRPGAGAWINPRPLFGAAALLGGVDIRAALSRWNLTTPSAIRADLFATEGDLGLSLRLDNLLPVVPAPAGPAYNIRIGTDDPLLELSFPALERAWRFFDPPTTPFFLANIDILALTPRSAALNVWRDDAGALHWAAVLLLPNRERAEAQLARVAAWIRYLETVSPRDFGLDKGTSRWGDPLHRIRVGAVKAVLGLAGLEAGGMDHAAIIIADTPQTWPNPFDLHAAPGDADTLTEWRIRLDPAAKQRAAAALARHSKAVQRPALDRLFPDTDSGHIRLDGDSVEFLSRHGLTPLVLPGAAEALQGLF